MAKENRLKPNTVKNPNRERSLYLINLILLCLITIGCIVAGGYMFWHARSLQTRLNETQAKLEEAQKENESLIPQEELESQVRRASESSARSARDDVMMQIQSSLESGNSTQSMLRNLFADDLVVVSNGKYYFYPVLGSVDKNSFAATDFQQDDAGFMTYQGEDESVTLTNGIDVSQANGEISWQDLADEGISFAIVCGGGRGDDGKVYTDESFQDNMNGASKAGLSLGAYWKLDAMEEAEAIQEADHFISLLKNYKDQIRMPVAVWVEIPEPGSRTETVSRMQWTRNVKTFCRKIGDAGYRSVVYGNLAAFIMQTDIADLKNSERWIANYDARLYFPYDFLMWQYSNDAQISGIDGNVNLDAIITVR